MAITMGLIEKVYVFGKDIISGTLDEKSANEHLAKFGMNKKSARMYITCIVAMLSDTHYGSTVNAVATEHFLKSIYSDFGSKKLEKALRVLKLHIEYQKGKNNLPSLKNIYDKYYELI